MEYLAAIAGGLAAGIVIVIIASVIIRIFAYEPED